VVRSHRGRIAVQSGTGCGATVTLHLPVVLRAARAPAPSMSDAAPAPRSHGLVLVVDDEPVVRGVTVRILKKAGYDVVDAASGEDALVAFDRLPAPPDAALLDLTMPGMDGVTLATNLLVRAPAMRIVLMTGYGDAETVEAASRAGVRTVLPKPFRTDDLLRVLKAAEGGPPLS
jgi:CheY-like chemotaxis protein